ncbi:MAG: RNA polymerase sigma factor [bacterium]
MSIPAPDFTPPVSASPAQSVSAISSASIPILLKGKSDEVIRAYYFYLKNVAMKIVRPDVANEIGYSDIVMNTLLVGFSKANSFKGESDGQLRSWLVGIMKNLHRRYRRDILRRNMVSLERSRHSSDKAADNMIREVIDPNSDQPFDYATRQEVGSLLHNAIAQLPWRQKVVVEMYLHETENFRVIAENLGIEKSAAEKRYQRALRLLREMDEISRILGKP